MQHKQKPIDKITLETLKSEYWLKSELIKYCSDHALSTAGSKQALIQRIETFLKTGAKIHAKIIKSTNRDSHLPIKAETLVNNYNNDAATRDFFISQLGNKFRFNAYLRQFTNKDNVTPGLTYGDLVSGWRNEESMCKQSKNKQEIDSQFEYNRFVRDFYANEKGKSHAEMVKAWKVVKELPGDKTYERYRLSYLS